MTIQCQLVGMEQLINQIRDDVENTRLDPSEGREMLADIKLSQIVAETAEELNERARIQTVLENAIKVVSALA